MNDMSAMLLIPILTITVVLSLSVSNVYALTTVKNTDFSIDIQDNWAFDLIHMLSSGVQEVQAMANFYVHMI